MKIVGKTVLITGGCSGIGKIMARRCLEKGAGKVIIWDINEAAIGWSQSLRIELEREKSPVKVTTIAPYFINTGMFDGIHSFFRILPPEEVARKSLRAIELGLGYRGINFPEHFIRLMQGIFPHSWFNFVFGDICELYTVMDHFTGRK